MLVFTLNKRDGEDLPTKPTFRDPIRYLKYQLERGEGGRLHFQGVLVLDRQHSLDVVKRTLAVDHVHLEVCRSVKHAIAYCGKVETRVDGPWEFGELPKGQGTNGLAEAHRVDRRHNDDADVGAKRTRNGGQIRKRPERCF